MMTGGLIVMALMMGAMFLFGHKTGHKHAKPAGQEVTVSSATAVSTAPAPDVARPAASKEAEHH